MHKIIRLLPEKPYKLRITYDNGKTVVFDASPLVKMDGIFTDLADFQQFAAAKVRENGRGVEWPNGADLCADAIWYEASGDRNPFDEAAS